MNAVIKPSRMKPVSAEVLAEREACSRICEGRAILHKEEGRHRESREAYMLAECIRERKILD